MIKPMLCKLVSKPFIDKDWLWEVKHNGFRIIATAGGQGRYTLQARSGTDKTRLFPELNLRTKAPAILDGEIACFSRGKTVFSSIQHRMNRLEDIEEAASQYPAQYIVFDILEIDGHSLQHLPLKMRKEILEDTLIQTSTVCTVPNVLNGLALFKLAEENDLEGIVGKLREGTYRQGKRDWLKVKVLQRGTFIICGYTAGIGKRAPTFGALVLGQRTVQGLRYVGNVGTGFTDEELDRLYGIMVGASRAGCPFRKSPEREIGATWINAYIEVRIEYTEMTNDNKLFHPVYKGTVIHD